ncbi:MAG TPA: glycosyltransferase [Terriglobales bacterium]|nr:glycosyltransferase [Terriglobales bacterium]
MSTRCCVVIPAYNEAAHLAALVPAIFDQAALLPAHELFVLIVDDNSTDDTGSLIAALQTRYANLRTLNGKKRGLGVAYQRGFAFALETLRADLIVQMDGDYQHDPAALPFLIHACQPAVAAVVGSRFAPGGSTPTFSQRRRAVSVGGNWLIHRFAGLPHLYDYTSGFRCLSAPLVARCLEQCRLDHLATRGYAFQSSLIAELLLTRQPVIELPIVFGQRQHGHSKLTLRDYLEFAANLRQLRRRSRKRAAVTSS